MSENKRVDLNTALNDWIEFAKTHPTNEDTMDNAMADIQADDMKHYDDLPARIAQKLLESASNDQLEDCYYEYQKEWAETLSEKDLIQTARDLGIDL